MHQVQRQQAIALIDIDSITCFDELSQVCPSGGIGRHKGFKIPRLIGVPVQVWPRVPSFTYVSMVQKSLDISRGFFVSEIYENKDICLLNSIALESDQRKVCFF